MALLWAKFISFASGLSGVTKGRYIDKKAYVTSKKKAHSQPAGPGWKVRLSRLRDIVVAGQGGEYLIVGGATSCRSWLSSSVGATTPPAALACRGSQARKGAKQQTFEKAAGLRGLGRLILHCRIGRRCWRVGRLRQVGGIIAGHWKPREVTLERYWGLWNRRPRRP